MMSRLNVTLLLLCCAAMVLVLAACVVPEELGETTAVAATPSPEGESSPLAPASANEALSSPLGASPLPVPPVTGVVTDVAGVIEGPRGPKEEPESKEEMSGERERAVEAAIAALVDKTGVSDDQIELVSVESVQFRDSSLGCPQRGMMYLQVITPGYRVILSLEDQVYDYRVAGKWAVLCEGGQ
jgi:hypothetical protein